MIVATPCTAPFMAAALGFALAQPGAADPGGLRWRWASASPLPYLRSRLDPGAARLDAAARPWMDRLRQFLAFPMYASAVWMVWVLTPADRAGRRDRVLGGMILIAFAIWVLGAAQAAPAGRRRRRSAAPLAAGRR